MWLQNRVSAVSSVPVIEVLGSLHDHTILETVRRQVSEAVFSICGLLGGLGQLYLRSHCSSVLSRRHQPDVHVGSACLLAAHGDGHRLEGVRHVRVGCLSGVLACLLLGLEPKVS